MNIQKGDPVMLILKRRYEFWFCTLALNKIGAITIPATHLLTTKDIIYRNNAASVKIIVSVSDPEVVEHINESVSESDTLKFLAVIEKDINGWFNFNVELEKASSNFVKPLPEEMPVNTDTMLLYFTSGTTGMPKMVNHSFIYPLGHILTAKFWQNVENDGLHFTVADTGWAKSTGVRFMVNGYAALLL